MAFVVVLQSNVLVSIKKDWILNSIQNTESLVYHSPTELDHPIFHLPPSYYFKPDAKACYIARVIRKFGNF